MAKKMSVKEVAQKVEWEGDVIETAINYGLSAIDISDPKLAELWKKLQIAYSNVQPIVDEIEAILDEANEDE